MRFLIHLLIFFSSSPAFASGDVPVVAQVINTALLFAVLFFFMKTPIVHTLTNRAKLIKDDLEQAQIALKRAEQQNRELKAELEKMASEIKDLEVQAQRDAELLKKDLSEKANADIEKIKLAVQQSIQSQTQSAILEIKEEVAKQAVGLAEQKIKLQIQQDDQSKLHKQFIQQVSSM